MECVNLNCLCRKEKNITNLNHIKIDVLKVADKLNIKLPAKHLICNNSIKFKEHLNKIDLVLDFDYFTLDDRADVDFEFIVTNKTDYLQYKVGYELLKVIDNLSGRYFILYKQI